MHALDDTITRLRKVIKKHREVLMGYEALTRSALIDPMLTALGWDVTDLEVVRPEHPVPSRGKSTDHTDYALFAKPNKISVIIEAKKLDASDGNLKDAHRDAGFKAGQLEAPYFAITDGDHWEMYRRDLAKDPMMKFRLTHGTRTELYHEALCLWRRNLGKRIFSTNPKPTKSPTTGLTPQAPPITDPRPSSQEWVPLTKWETVQSFHKPRAQLNLVVRFPDHTENNARTWRDVARIIINFLDRKGLLENLQKSPLKQKGKLLFANTKFFHDTGRKFRDIYPVANSGLYFNLDMSTALLMNAIVLLLENAHQNPDGIYLGNRNKPKALEQSHG